MIVIEFDVIKIAHNKWTTAIGQYDRYYPLNLNIVLYRTARKYIESIEKIVIFKTLTFVCNNDKIMTLPE